MNSEKTINQKIPCESGIYVNITDFTLTPQACASLINEIIKSLLYQKSQIPYPYNWLRSSVNRKRKRDALAESSNKEENSISINKHYRIASNAFDALEEIMHNIRKQFEDTQSIVREVLLIFGSTPYTPKEAFSIRVPHIASGHIESNHVQEIIKHQHKVLGNILFSDIWLASMEKTISTTHMYVLLKKSEKTNNISSDDFFLVNNNYELPCNIKNVVINLNYDNDTCVNCCKNLAIFQDSPDLKTDAAVNKNFIGKDFGSSEWYQATVLVKGFKDHIINKSSVSDLW